MYHRGWGNWLLKRTSLWKVGQIWFRTKRAKIVNAVHWHLAWMSHDFFQLFTCAGLNFPKEKKTAIAPAWSVFIHGLRLIRMNKVNLKNVLIHQRFLWPLFLKSFSSWTLCSVFTVGLLWSERIWGLQRQQPQLQMRLEQPREVRTIFTPFALLFPGSQNTKMHL